MKMRVLIIDDEPLAREGIVFQLRNESDVEIVGECEDGSAAIEAIKRQKPDLVFLDIKMPKVSGFNVIEQIGSSNMPLVVFLTAYDEYAVEAFRLNALDYLLKPIDRARFQQSLQKARKQLQKDRLSTQGAQLEQLLTAMRNTGKPIEPEVPPRIAVKLGGSIQFLHPDELLWVEAEGDYVNVHTTARSHLVRETMLAMEKRLEPYGFQRIHRSAIVNLDKIAKLAAAENGDYEVLMTNGLPLKIGRNYREALFSRMKISV